MTNEQFITEIEAYCKDANLKPSTVCVRALGNSRFFDRLKRRTVKIEQDVNKIREYMAQNPPKPTNQNEAA